MANVTVTLTGDEAKLLRALDRVVQKEREVARATGETDRASKRSGESSMKAFGAGAVRQLATYAIGVAGVGAAWGLVKRAIQEVDQETTRLAAKQRESARGLSSLAQLAGGDPARMQALVGEARAHYRAGGAPSLDEAARIVFSLESAGALGERPLFAQLAGIVDDPAIMARAATTLMTSVGRAETGGMRQVLSKAMAASKYSPASAEALLEAGARGGGYARRLGISDEELMAATAIMATATGGAELGGTAVASMLAAFTKKGGYKGLGMGASLQKVQALGLSDEDLVKYLGRKEAFRGYSTLVENIPQIETIVEAQRIAEETDLVGRTIGARGAVPQIVAARAAERGAARLEMAGEQRGIRRNLWNALLDQVSAEWEEEGVSPFEIWLKRKGAGLTRLGPGREEAVVMENPETRELYMQAVEEGVRRGSRPTALAHPDQDR